MATLHIGVTSAGNRVGNTASFAIDGKRVDMPYGRGLNVVVIDPATGGIVNTYTYDTAGSPPQAEALAQMIETLPVGRIVAIAIKDDAGGRLPRRAEFACETLGSALIANLVPQCSWGMVGQKGAPLGSAPEMLNPSDKVEFEAQQPLPPPQQLAYRVRLWSAGFEVGASFFIEVNGTRLEFAGSTRGLNVAVFDARSCQLVSQHTFDTHASPPAVQQFIALIDSLPEGQFVAIAVKDEAAAQLNEEARVAFESLGSGLIRQLEYGNSYALFGQKNADPGSGAESLSGFMPVFCESWIFPRPRLWQGFSVSTLRATPATGSVCASFVDGIAVGELTPGTRSILVTVIDEQSGISLQSETFDPEHNHEDSTKLSQLLYAVPVGRIVVISSIQGATSFLNPWALQACTQVGSAQIYKAHADLGGCWCIIGRKGAAPGSMPECSGRCCTALQFWVSPTASTRRASADIRLISAGQARGRRASINVNGHELAEWQRGMNVAVFDEQICTILQTATYDTSASEHEAALFAALLEGLPLRRIVAIAVMDDAAKSLTEPARKACESIGSASIRQLSLNGSWVIVGTKGAQPGTVPEVLGSDTQTAFLSYQLFPARAKTWPGATVRAHSMGMDAGDPTFITVNGQRVEMPYGRGLNVVVIDWGSGDVTHRERFDTGGASKEPAEAFASLIEQLPFGQIVAVAVMGEHATRSITARARRACQMLGSKDIAEQFSTQNSSWAIVGCKGMGPGAAAETLNRHDGAAEVEAWIPLSPDKAIRSGVGHPAWLIAIFVAIFVLAILSIVTVIYNLATDSRSPPDPPRKRRRKALLIAIDYTGIPELDLAGYPSEIVDRVQRTVANLQLVDANHIHFMTEQAADPNLLPSRPNIEAQLNDLLSDAVNGDVLYVHYLGHGNRDTTEPNNPQSFITVLQ